MTTIPKFKLYGEDDVTFFEKIQCKLPLRPWSSLTAEETRIIYQDLARANWFRENHEIVVQTVEQLNHKFKRILPAKSTFKFIPKSMNHDLSQHYVDVATADFERIFICEESEDLVLFMISLFARNLIDQVELGWAQREENINERKRLWIVHIENLTNL